MESRVARYVSVYVQYNKQQQLAVFVIEESLFMCSG